jgi:hypothetical protein
VLLKTTLANARSRAPPFVANLEETPDGVILRTQADNLRTAARYLVGVEWDFSVHCPPELLQEVRHLGAELL